MNSGEDDSLLSLVQSIPSMVNDFNLLHNEQIGQIDIPIESIECNFLSNCNNYSEYENKDQYQFEIFSESRTEEHDKNNSISSD